MKYEVINSHRKPARVTVWIDEPGKAPRRYFSDTLPAFKVGVLDLILAEGAKVRVTSIPAGVVTVHTEGE